MSFALLFSGQGTQHPDMLPWLADDAIVRTMCRQLGIRDWRAAAADPQWSQRNANAQTLLTGLALAAWQQIAPALRLRHSVARHVGSVLGLAEERVLGHLLGRDRREQPRHVGVAIHEALGVAERADQRSRKTFNVAVAVRTMRVRSASPSRSRRFFCASAWASRSILSVWASMTSCSRLP